LVPGDATLPGMLTVLAALSSTTKTIEFVIIAVVVLLLILTIVLYARKNAQMKKPTTRRWPELVLRRAAGRRAGPVPLPGTDVRRSPARPFAGFAPAAQAPQPAYAAPAAQQQAPAYQGPAAAPAPAPLRRHLPPPGGPAPGTPPAGCRTERCTRHAPLLDGNAWTQHVAQRG